MFENFWKGCVCCFVKLGQVFNCIYVVDIVGVVVVVMSRFVIVIYNVIDDEFVLFQDVVIYVVELLGVELLVEILFEIVDLMLMV